MNVALFRLALRRLLLRRRSLLLAFAPMLSALVAVIQAAEGSADSEAFASLMEQLFLPCPAVPGARDRRQRDRRGA